MGGDECKPMNINVEHVQKKQGRIKYIESGHTILRLGFPFIGILITLAMKLHTPLVLAFGQITYTLNVGPDYQYPIEGSWT
jgi:hypothetical protein